MREDMRGAVYASGEMRVIVVRRPASVDVVLSDDRDAPSCEAGVVLTDSVLLAYLICTSDCTCRIIMTTDEDLRSMGYQRIYAFEDTPNVIFEKCEYV